MSWVKRSYWGCLELLPYWEDEKRACPNACQPGAALVAGDSQNMSNAA